MISPRRTRSACALLATGVAVSLAGVARSQDKAGNVPGKDDARAGKPAAGSATVPADAGAAEREAARPGEALVAREREVWTLEGRLVAEAQSLLRSPEAKKELGEGDVAGSGEAEARVRGWLRGKRAAELREAARAFVAGCDRPTRELLERAALPSGLSSEDVLMDWLTYDGLFDLALVRDGWRRFKAGQVEGAAKDLAASFFGDLPKLPESSSGITVAAPDERSLDVRVFGARVRSEVLSSKVEHRPAVGRVGIVEWRSNYEKLRAQIRSREAVDPIREELVLEDGRFRMTYALEVDEYLVGGATQPWALSLALASADDLADLYAGVAASAGLDAAPRRAVAKDPGTLPVEGRVGTEARGAHFKVVQTQAAAALGAAKPRRGKFLIVTVAVQTGVALRVPGQWFRLEAAQETFPEVGVARPGLGANVLALAEAKDAKLVSVPFTAVGASGTATLALVFDVPVSVDAAALSIGAHELSLKVSVTK